MGRWNIDHQDDQNAPGRTFRIKPTINPTAAPIMPPHATDTRKKPSAISPIGGTPQPRPVPTPNAVTAKLGINGTAATAPAM